MVHMFLILACLVMLGYGAAKVINSGFLLAFYDTHFDIDAESYTFTDTPDPSAVPTRLELLGRVVVGLTLMVGGTVGLIYTTVA